MYRLLIVDDEEHVVNYLAELFSDTDQIELDIYTAYSAKSALRVLEDTNIDIIITDYRMPGMNGLELLDTIVETWVTRRVIFLSGYSEFDYIYRAAAKGAVRYILKTEDDDVIVDAVCEAAASIEAERSQLVDARAAEKQEGLLQYVDLCDSVRQILDNGVTADDSGFDSRAPLVPAICVTERAVSEMKRSERLQLRFSMNLLSQKLLAPYVRNLFLESDNGVLFWIIQPLNPGHTAFRSGKAPSGSYLAQLFENVQNACRNSLDLRIGVYLSSEAIQWKALRTTVEMLAIRADTLDVLRSEQANVVVSDPEAEPNEAVAEQSLVRRIQYFVLSNLGGDLSLTNISEHVYYNPSYVSRIYKSVTGTNLSAYITSKRMERARALLSTTRMSVTDVAHDCGYESPQYFSTVFKRQVGLTPHDFREQARLGKADV